MVSENSKGMPSRVEPGDIDLMRRLFSDEAAFCEFYSRHQGGVYRFALHMTGKPEMAADIVQETFMTLMRQASKFDQDKGSPVAFLYGIARNHLKKLHDREGRYVSFSDEFDGGGPEAAEVAQRAASGRHGWPSEVSGEAETVLEGLERAEAVALLRETILKLPPHYREPVTLCDLEGKSYEDASEILGCPVGTVRSRLNRARSILLQRLRPVRGAKTKEVRFGGKA